MEREDTKHLFKIITSIYPRFIQREETKADATVKIDTWTEALKEYPYDTVHGALMEYIRDDTDGFPPIPGQLIAFIEAGSESDREPDRVYYGLYEDSDE